MKNIVLTSTLLTVILGLSLSSTSFAQKNELSIKAGRPFPVGDTFLSRYDGVYELGISYGRSILKLLILRVFLFSMIV